MAQDNKPSNQSDSAMAGEISATFQNLMTAPATQKSSETVTPAIESQGNPFESLMQAPKPSTAKKGPTVSTTEDVLRSGAGGLERGAAALVGLPGDVGALARFGGEYAKYYGKKGLERAGYQPEGGAEEYWKGVEKERASPERDYVGVLPTSSATIKWAEKNLPGADWKPQTTSGKYAASIGEMAPTALTAFIPGLQEPFAAALGRAAVSGVGAEAASHLVPEKYEPYARLAGAVAAPMAASKFVAPTLGTVASKLGASDRAIEAVGLKSPTGLMQDRVMKEIQRMKSTGEFTGMSADELQRIRNAEIADNIPESESRIRAYWALGDSPTDIVKRFMSEHSLRNPKINDEIKRLLADHNVNAKVIDDMAGQILGTMHDDATLNALNRFRSQNGIQDMLTEPPTLSEAKKFANEVRENLYEKTYGQAFAAFPSINTSRLNELFENSKSAQSIGHAVMRDLNESRMAKGLDPLDFINYDTENSLFKIGRETADGYIAGAPLEYWDRLVKKLYNMPDQGPKDTAAAFRKELDDYFTRKKIENPLKKAQETYGDIKYGSNALDEGATFVQDLKLTPSTTRRQRALSKFDNLSDAEKGLYQAGALQQIYTLLTQADGYKVLDKLLKTGDNRTLIKKVLDWKHPDDVIAAAVKGGPTNYERFEQALNLSKIMRMENAANILGNTTPVRGLLRRITSPQAFGLAGIVLNSVENAFFGGTPLGLISLGYGGIKYVRQVLEDQRSRKFLNMMISRDPNDAIKLAQMVERTPADKAAWRKVLSLLDFGNKATQRAYRQTTAGYVGTRPGEERQKERKQRQSGGRVGYGPGGEVPFDDQGEDDRPARDLDKNRMFSPTMRATEAMRPAVSKQRMPVAEAMKTIVNKEPRALYEMIHSGYAHPDSTPENIIPDWAAEQYHPEGTASPYDIGQWVGPTSPVPKVVEFKEADAPYYKWPNRRYQHGRDYFEMPVIVEPRKSSKEGQKIFVPDREDLSVSHEIVPRSYNIHNPYGPIPPENRLHQYSVLDKARNILHVKSSNDPLTESEQDALKERALVKHIAAHYELANRNTTQTHYPNEGLNAFHVRGQTISPFDGSTFNHNEPFLNIDEIQSDAHQASRKYKSDELKKRRYSAGELQKTYKDIADTFSQAEKLRAEHKKLLDEAEQKRSEGNLLPIYSSERGKKIDEIQELIKKAKSISDWGQLEGEGYAKKIKFQSLLNSIGQVPPLMPYGDEEKKYTEMAIKLMLNKAIDEGHKGISFTPWQEQILRNGFATPAKNMSFDPKENILKVESNNFLKQIKVDYQDMLAQHGDPLEEFVGKSTASLLRKNPNKMIYQQEHPLFWIEGNPSKAKKAERTVQYYHKTLPNELLKYLRKIDPNVDMEDIGVFPSIQSIGLGPERIFPHKGVRLTDKIIKHIRKHGQPAFAKGGQVNRPTRATGGRIPEVDKLFKSAKKELDGSTKPILNYHDDDIVKALRIMQGRV